VVELRHGSGAAALVHLHGAHVTSWRTADGRERLFLSSASRFEDGVAIRGGIPVIFPQFADRGPLGKHGFARLSPWRFLGADGPASARFGLEASAATRAVWPAEFGLELSVTVGERELDVALAVTARSAFEFTAALHTYLAVADVERVVVHGLAGTTYESGVEGVSGAPQVDDDVLVRGELDRVYLDVRHPVVVREAGASGGVVVRSEGFRDVVLWNPGPEKARALTDLGPGEQRRMLCVESAAVGVPVRLDPGTRWAGRQTLIADG
jgi:glucose-6-phosphate 1-epimerase